MTKPLIFLDPYPRNEEMVFSEVTQAALSEMGDLVTHFGSRAPDAMVEDVLPEVAIIVGQTAMPRQRIERAPKLRGILNVKANWEPNIDYTEADLRGIHVLSAAPCMAPAVAEAALALAIALGRRIVSADCEFRLGAEQYGIAGNHDSKSLFGARVGLIGFGNLARALVPLLVPFGCEISAYDPWVPAERLAKCGITASSLDTLLAHSDVIFVLAGATTENEGFLGRARLEQIAEDASVILISRAEVVDFGAVVELAEMGRFRLAIDVFPEEPVPKSAAVRQAKNVILSAHRAGGIHASYRRIQDAMIADIGHILAGQPPQIMQRAEPHLAAMSRSR